MTHVFGSPPLDRGEALVKNAQNDLVLQYLTANPMSALVDLAARSAGTTQFAGHCDACRYAIGSADGRHTVESRIGPAPRRYPFWFTVGPGCPVCAALS